MKTDWKANVLLVDDKPENLLALESVLADLDQNLVRASSAREALRFLLIEDVALILLDVQMPGLSGFELAELIRERERTQHTPIIFISATSVHDQNIFKGYSLGAVDYLTKPIQPEILKSKVIFFSKLFLQQSEIKRQSKELGETNARLDELNTDLEERVRLRTKELEKANNELEAEVQERRESEARLATEHAITRSLALADSIGTAIPEILKAFVENMGATVAAQWDITPDGSSLACSNVEFAASESANVSSFVAETKRRKFARGIGLPGQVWANGAPIWLPSTTRADNFPRAAYATAAGIKSAVGFPIRNGNDIFGVVEFFTTDSMQAERKLLDMLEAIGSEIGQFIQKKRVEEERESLLAREKMLREEAETANRLKDEFLATLSHELRTPLNSILGWSQIVLNDMVGPDGLRTALETIHRNATSQAQLIEELLEASRLITGKLLLNLSPTDVVQILEAAIDVVRPRASAKNIEISGEFDRDIPTITSDSSRLQQMVWNLLTNAVKFTPSGGRIDVRYIRSGETVRIVIADTGMGISKDFLPYVFDRFRQQDSTSTRRHDGLGLGLAIVRHLAELHGGSVAAESGGPGTGSTFIISLPLTATGDIPDVEAYRPEDNGHSDYDRSLGGVRVHVVDDDEDACNMLKFAFELRGAEVTTSSTASQALEAIAQQPPDILLADINMPGEDGYSLIAKVRELSVSTGKSFPAIALTAMARSEDTERALAAGFHMHIPKPVEIDELAETIAQLLRRQVSNHGAPV